MLFHHLEDCFNIWQVKKRLSNCNKRVWQIYIIQENAPQGEVPEKVQLTVRSRKSGTSRWSNGLREWIEAVILAVSALLLGMLNCVDRCYNFMHNVISFFMSTLYYKYANYKKWALRCVLFLTTEYLELPGAINRRESPMAMRVLPYQLTSHACILRAVCLCKYMIKTATLHNEDTALL